MKTNLKLWNLIFSEVGLLVDHVADFVVVSAVQIVIDASDGFSSILCIHSERKKSSDLVLYCKISKKGQSK